MERRIGLFPRLGALAVDSLLVGLCLAAAGHFSGAPPGLRWLLPAGPLVGALYFLIEAFTGASFGKLLLGLRAADAGGGAASIRQRLVRWVCKHPHLLLGTVAALTSLGFLEPLGAALGAVAFAGCFAARDGQRQALHDILAGTAVFRSSALREEPAPPPAMPAA